MPLHSCDACVKAYDACVKAYDAYVIAYDACVQHVSEQHHVDTAGGI